MKNILTLLIVAFSFAVQAQQAKTEADFLLSSQEVSELGFADTEYEKAYVVRPDYSKEDVRLLTRLMNEDGISASLSMDNWKYEGDLKQIRFMAFGSGKEMLCNCATDNLGTMMIVKKSRYEISCIQK